MACIEEGIREEREEMGFDTIPVSRARIIQPYLEFMAKLGAPVDRWLEQCRLPLHIYGDSEAYIPTMNFGRFLSLAAEKAGIDDFGIRVSHDGIFNILGPRVVIAVHSAPTLLAGMKNYDQTILGESNKVRVFISRRDGGTVQLTIRRAITKGASGFFQSEWMCAISLVKMVQLFAGRPWQPDTIELKTERVVPPLAHGLYPDVHFRTNQPETCVTFPEELLSLGRCSYGKEVVSELTGATTDLEPSEPPADYPSAVQALVTTYLREGYPSKELVAEIAGVSVRTLHRRLASCGVNYKIVINRARFEVAARLLTETDLSSLEITFETGYEDPSHFARGFRRISGCSPSEYRRRQRVEVQ